MPDADPMHEAGRGPTPEEEAAAERADVDPERTARPYEEMTEKGASQRGEGRIDD